MILVTAHVRIQPEHRDAVLAILVEVQTASRLDDGCESYGYFESIDEPHLFSAIEMWRDREALDAHLRTDHVRKLVDALGKYVAEPPAIVAHTVTASDDLVTSVA
jgi:quinol monooxygenase YgiN